MYIEGGISEEDENWIFDHPTILDGKRILIVDEVSRTGSTLDIAKHLFRLAIPDFDKIDGTYFWHPSEPLLKIGNETVLTSLPVWYDPNTLMGRGIGSPDERYYRELYKEYLSKSIDNEDIDVNKFKTYAFSSSVFSAPLLDDEGKALDLTIEKKTRDLCRDLRKLYDEYKAGNIFFVPPNEWMDFDDFEDIIEQQGVILLPWEGSEQERERVRNSPMFYINFITRLKNA